LTDNQKPLSFVLYGDASWQFEQPILERYPDVEIMKVLPRDAASTDFGAVQCALGWKFPKGAFQAMPNLKWVQSISVGVDNWVYDPTIPPDAMITNTKGLYAKEVAEYIVWALITLSRRFHVVLRNQQRRHWRQIAGYSLVGKTVGIAGMGHLGRAAAKAARSLGLRVVGICRVADDAKALESADSVVSSSAMDDVLGELDFLVICLPLTRQTRGMFGAEQIARLKPRAIVVNAARESIVDYTSLTKAVQQGHIAGAALDVFDQEPLRRWSRIWKEENILVTPHVSALTKEYKAKVAGLVCDNIDRLRSGRDLKCLVDRTKGY
jgi:phosphoglycerate dehydrogenase-like enzyme